MLFPEPPVVAFRQPKSIKDTLIRAAVSRPSSTVGQCKPCGDKRCCNPQTWQSRRKITLGVLQLTLQNILLLSCRLAMEHLCVLQLETALATLVTTWFTLADGFQRPVKLTEMTSWSTKKKRSTNGFPLFSLTILL
jgi:hypothetical protein